MFDGLGLWVQGLGGKVQGSERWNMLVGLHVLALSKSSSTDLQMLGV